MHLHERTRSHRCFVEFWTTDTGASGTVEVKGGMLPFGRVLFRSCALVILRSVRWLWSVDILVTGAPLLELFAWE
jgi:hypothetical protein